MEKETFLPYCLGSTGRQHLEGGENFRGSVLVHKVFNYFWLMWTKPNCLLNFSYLNGLGLCFQVSGLSKGCFLEPCLTRSMFFSHLLLFHEWVSCFVSFVCVCCHKKLVYLCWLPDSIILCRILFGTVMPGFIPVIERFPSDLRPRSPS